MKDQGKPNQGHIKQLKKMQQLVADLTSWKNEHESLADELKQSELKFRKLSEKSVVGIYLIQDGLLKYLNPKFAHIFGYKVDEIINKLEVKAIIFPEDWPIVEENIRKRISGEVESIHFQFREV